MSVDVEKESIFKTAIDDCDVNDKSKLACFRSCFAKWSNWIGKNQIAKNTIWHQCIEMLTNDYIFQGFNSAAYLQHENGSQRNYLANNGALSKFLIEGYFSYQYIAIRRLIDDGPDVHSLKNLVRNMKDNAHCITREIFVSYDGLPYDYEELLKNARAKMIKDSLAGVIWHAIPDAEWSLERHAMFDRMSNKTKEKRLRTDTIESDYWDKLEKTLNIEALRNVKKYTDAYIAHALKGSKIAKKLEEEDKIQSIRKIKECHTAIRNVLEQLFLDFWFTCVEVKPLTDESRVIYNMDKPFVDYNVIEQVKNKLEAELKIYNKYGR